MKNKKVITILFSAFIIIIFFYLASPIMITQIIKLKLRNPIEEATSDFKNGEKRYIGVYGDCAFTPGVDFIIKDKNSVKYYMPNTSDAIEGVIHHYLIDISTEYAKLHNLKIKQLLAESNKIQSTKNTARDASHP